MIDQKLERWLTSNDQDAKDWRKARPDELERLDLEQRDAYAATFGVRLADVPNWEKRRAENKALGDHGYPPIVQWEADQGQEGGNGDD